MTEIELLAAIKVVVYLAPLALLLRGAEWPWLTACVIVLIISNTLTATGVDRLATVIIGFLFQAFLVIHCLKLAKFRRPG